MNVFRQQAELRTTALKNLLQEMEQDRDRLLDEVAERKGRAAQLEILIARAYEMILDINKNEQDKELKHVAETLERKQQEEESARKQQEREAFHKAKEGIKTPKVPRRKRTE